MINKNCFLKSDKARFVLNAALLIALTRCVSIADAQGIRITVPVPVVVVSPPVVAVAPPVVVVAAPPVVVAEDNYVYYPSYGIYFNTSRHQYAYLDGGAWVSRPASA